jgi:hypothetical protein
MRLPPHFIDQDTERGPEARRFERQQAQDMVYWENP